MKEGRADKLSLSLTGFEINAQRLSGRNSVEVRAVVAGLCLWSCVFETTISFSRSEKFPSARNECSVAIRAVLSRHAALNGYNARRSTSKERGVNLLLRATRRYYAEHCLGEHGRPQRGCAQLNEKHATEKSCCRRAARR